MYVRHRAASSQSVSLLRRQYTPGWVTRVTFRRAYDVLVERSQKWADLEYVRILHLAATTMECEVDAALGALLQAGEVPEFELVKARVKPTVPQPVPDVHVRMPDLAVYDSLLQRQGVSA